MKHSTRKGKCLNLLVLCMLILCIAIAALYMPNSSFITYAATEDYQVQEEKSKVLKHESDQTIAKTREKYKDLREFSYSPEIEKIMAETGKTVGEGLVEQICYYQ